MKVDFTGRQFQLDEGIREYAEERLSKLSKFVDDPVDVHVILEVEKHRQIAELHVSHRHGVLQATEQASDMRDALHAATVKLEKQARRSRKKLVDKRRRAQRQDEESQHWPLDVLEGASLGSGSRPRVIRTTRLPIKPMTIDEAALGLERSKNEFFVFLDSTTERVSVLYRRRDDNYGLIAPEI